MMRKILMAGAAALLVSGPAFAQSTQPSQTQMPAQGANTPKSSAGAVSGGMSTTQKPEQAEMPAHGAETPSSSAGATTGKMGAVQKPSQTEMPGQGAETPRSKAGQVTGTGMNNGMTHRSTMQAPTQRKTMGHSQMGNGQMAASAGQKGGIPKSELKAVPYDASTDTYLQIAQKAVSARHKMRADIALGRAETNLLTNSYVAGSVNGPISSPAINIIRKAREAVHAGHYSDANALIQKAMSEPAVKQSGSGGSSMNGNGGSTNNGSMNNGMQK